MTLPLFPNDEYFVYYVRKMWRNGNNQKFYCFEIERGHLFFMSSVVISSPYAKHLVSLILFVFFFADEYSTHLLIYFLSLDMCSNGNVRQI